MTNKPVILRFILYPKGGMHMNGQALLVDLPTSVRGFCYHDNDGEEYIVLNARLSREQNRITYRHERRHIARGDLYNESYQEYKEESS